MSGDEIHSSLRHDLLGALSAAQLDLHTLEALETGDGDVTREKRLSVIHRSMRALTEAVALAERLGAHGSDSLSDPK